MSDAEIVNPQSSGDEPGKAMPAEIPEDEVQLSPDEAPPLAEEQTTAEPSEPPE